MVRLVTCNSDQDRTDGAVVEVISSNDACSATITCTQSVQVSTDELLRKRSSFDYKSEAFTFSGLTMRLRLRCVASSSSEPQVRAFLVLLSSNGTPIHRPLLASWTTGVSVDSQPMTSFISEKIVFDREPINQNDCSVMSRGVEVVNLNDLTACCESNWVSVQLTLQFD
ncbi:hypothetical protein BOX15_Mlig029714g2 [Macrostomum lignano]|uniref:Uncharacterized protein n=1 Tax=Macrostomum lignano TaxID=282301 RepID=A0A267G6J0_9PLAT|nr:hypothetical protein BOX15_Mlig029714g2 [Macrostomum lignano]